MKEYNFDNINEFFEELMNKPNAKINMLHVYGAYERECERIKREQEILDNFNYPKWYNHNTHVAYIVNNNIAIIEELRDNKTVGYFSFVNNKKSNICWATFEQALLCAISILMTGSEDAAE